MSFVLLGATGDLAKKKLVPALQRLFLHGTFSQPIICVGRQNLNLQQYISFLEPAKYLDSKRLKEFLRLITYCATDFNQPMAAGVLKKLEKNTSQRLLYLALPSNVFPIALKHIVESGLLKKKNSHKVLFEKPFGSDLKTALALEKQIYQYCTEEQVYRIDHYLGKELVENIVALRFSNPLFEQIWSSKFIDHVQISLLEEGGIEERGSYYESAGAIRDMLQNHLLGLVSLVAMEQPLTLDSDDVHLRKEQILSSLVPVHKDHVVVGQYSSGIIRGKKVIGYKEEPHVAVRSKVETYVAVKMHVNTARWRGVPFYVRTGKRLQQRSAEIHIILKDISCNLFCGAFHYKGPNVITIRIQPHEGIALLFNAKVPGPGMELQQVLMDFCHECLFKFNTPEAYEMILQAAITGDKTLFTTADFIRNSWKWTDNVRMVSSERATNTYRAGTFGPKEADVLIGQDGREWINP